MTATGSQEVHSLAFVTLVCRCVHARRPTMSIGHSVWPISSRMLMSTSRPGTADVPRQTDSIEVFRQKTTLRRFQQHPRWVTTMVATPWPCAEAPDVLEQLWYINIPLCVVEDADYKQQGTWLIVDPFLTSWLRAQRRKTTHKKAVDSRETFVRGTAARTTRQSSSRSRFISGPSWCCGP
jgi:hypothetical protein